MNTAPANVRAFTMIWWTLWLMFQPQPRKLTWFDRLMNFVAMTITNVAMGLFLMIGILLLDVGVHRGKDNLFFIGTMIIIFWPTLYKHFLRTKL